MLLPQNKFASLFHIIGRCGPSALETTIGVAASVAVGRTGGGHAAQLVLPRELTAQLSKLGNQVLAGLDEGIFRGDGAIGLDADEELRHIRVSDYGVNGKYGAQQRAIRGTLVEALCVEESEDVWRKPLLL